MGLKGLWEALDSAAGAPLGQEINIATFAGQHFERTKRALRIAIDASIWKFNFYLTPEHVASIRANRPPANPSEKNILWRVLQLMRLNCQLVFVFDGPKRPAKRGNEPRIYYEPDDRLLKQMLDHLSIPWITAPAEAEAQCAAMEVLGHVDAVWTDDSDAFMFGSQLMIRFFWKLGETTAKGSKDIEKVKIYRAKDILIRFPGLDREGLVMWAVLAGGDYDTTGHAGTGRQKMVQVVKYGNGRLSKLLCSASNQEDFATWRVELRKCFASIGHHVLVPDTFPKPQVVQQYNQPLLSDPVHYTQKLRLWDHPIDEETLWTFMLHHFNFRAKEYIRWIMPIFLVRSLAQTAPGQEASNDSYKLVRIKKTPGTVEQSTVSFEFFALNTYTTMNVGPWLAVYGPDGYVQESRVTCERFLDVVLNHAVPNVMESIKAPKAKKTIAAAALSAEQTIKPKHTLVDDGVSATTPKKRGRPRKTSVDAADKDTHIPKKRNLSNTQSDGAKLKPAKPSVPLNSATGNHTKECSTANVSGSDTKRNSILTASTASPLMASSSTPVRKFELPTWDFSDSEDDEGVVTESAARRALHVLSPNSIRAQRLSHFGVQSSKMPQPAPKTPLATVNTTSIPKPVSARCEVIDLLSDSD